MENKQITDAKDSQHLRFGNLLKAFNTVLLTSITVLLLQQVQQTSVSQLEARQTSHLAYLEGRTNDLAAKVDSEVNKLNRRLDLVEHRSRLGVLPTDDSRFDAAERQKTSPC